MSNFKNAIWFKLWLKTHQNSIWSKQDYIWNTCDVVKKFCRSTFKKKHVCLNHKSLVDFTNFNHVFSTQNTLTLTKHLRFLTFYKNLQSGLQFLTKNFTHSDFVLCLQVLAFDLRFTYHRLNLANYNLKLHFMLREKHTFRNLQNFLNPLSLWAIRLMIMITE